MRLVLASASPARLATLRAAGIEPVVVVSDVDEDAALVAAAEALARRLSVAEQVAVLAEAKASAVVARLLAEGLPSGTGDHVGTDDHVGAAGPTLVLGCDSLLELDGEAYGKPATAQLATDRWRTMRGRAGVLHSGHHLVELVPGAPGAAATAAFTKPQTAAAVASTTVHFADVTDAEIAAYVATGEPLAVAGAFTIDGYGGAFVERIEGDHHAVVGLSLPLLRRLVADLGHGYPELWAPSAVL